jgi:hypothetical protein
MTELDRVEAANVVLTEFMPLPHDLAVLSRLFMPFSSVFLGPHSCG